MKFLLVVSIAVNVLLCVALTASKERFNKLKKDCESKNNYLITRNKRIESENKKLVESYKRVKQMHNISKTILYKYKKAI